MKITDVKAKDIQILQEKNTTDWKNKLMQAIMFISFSQDLDINTFTLSNFNVDLKSLYNLGCVPEQTLPQAYNYLTGVEEGIF